MMAPATRKHLVLVGLGNVGSNLVTYLGRLSPPIGHITVVDPDRYSTSNLASQEIAPRDVGRLKAVVAARRIRRLNPAIAVTALAQPFESVPLGLLRADLVVAAVDTKVARQAMNQAIWRLRIPLIDTGVESAQRLARVSLFVPEPEAACLECGFSASDYATLEQRHWCRGDSATPSTNAPVYLGALAAAVAAGECEKLLTGQVDQALVGRDVIIDGRHHTYAVTRHARNPRCRFDHRTWPEIQILDATPGRVTLGSALRLASLSSSQVGSPPNGAAQLRLDGHQFITRRRCSGCGETEDFLHLSRRLTERDCPSCGEPMHALGFYSQDRIIASDVSPADRRRSLRSLGCRRRDVISVSDGVREVHIQLGQ